MSDGPCTTESDSGDRSAVKQELQDVCMMHCYKYILLFVIQNKVNLFYLFIFYKVNLFNFAVTILNTMIEIFAFHVLMSYQQEWTFDAQLKLLTL